MSDWYKSSAQDVLTQLTSQIDHGLDSAEAKRRLEEYGPNELIDRGGKSPWRILLEQFTETMVIILIIAAVISILLGEIDDAIAIMVIVVLNGLRLLRSRESGAGGRS